MTRLRPGDQQLPVGNDQPVIHQLVQADLQARLELGISRYGQPLQPFNGRDVLRDIYEGLLDAAVYVKQAMVERDGTGYRAKLVTGPPDPPGYVIETEIGLVDDA